MEHPFDAAMVDGTLRVSGELDMDGANELWLGLVSAIEPGAQLRLDLSGVTFMDSSALSAMLRASQERDIAIVDASPQVARLLELTRTGPRFHVE